MKYFLSLFYLTVISILPARAQVQLRGAECVLPGIEYQYVIEGADSLGSLQVCITGGQLLDTSGSCLASVRVSIFRVRWNDSVSTGRLVLTTPAGNDTLLVAVTTSLNAGTIALASRKQLIDNEAKPALITCTPATGGGCGGTYSYEWQQSADRLSWQPVEGATGQNLQFNTAMQQPLYFRRKVIHQQSKATGYSDEVAVFVNMATPAASGTGQ